MEIEHSIKLLEDELTLKGQLLNIIFKEGERGDFIRHYKKDKTRFLSSSFSPSLTKYSLFVWGESEKCDNIEVKHTYDSKKQALKMLTFINKFVVGEVKEKPKKKVKKNWTGNNKSVYTCLGASNHSVGEREINDFYATEKKATELLLELETFDRNIWEVACGQGHMSKVLEEAGYKVRSTDLIDRGFGQGGIDFLKVDEKWNHDVVSNAPYKYAQSFIEKALEIITVGSKVAMFLKLTFLEGQKRKEFFLKTPPIRIWVSSSRLSCAKGGDFEKYKSSAVAYGWYIWEKGFIGKTTLDWFN